MHARCLRVERAWGAGDGVTVRRSAVLGQVTDSCDDIPAPGFTGRSQKKSGGPKTSALTCRLLLFDQAIEKMPRPPFAPIPTSVFCTLV